MLRVSDQVRHNKTCERTSSFQCSDTKIYVPRHEKTNVLVIPPVYEVYRGYIVFAFSVCVCV